MEQTRVLIVDDHYFVRKGIRMFLETEPDIEVVGEAEDGNEALRQTQRLQPDVILMDLSMPKGDGLQAIAAIKRLLPTVKIIVLTMHEQATKIVEAIVEAGADGYLLKDADENALLQAIKAVRRGDVPLHPRVARHLVRGVARHDQDSKQPVYLTEREKQVLRLVSKGLSNKEAAETLNLSSGTVKIHVSNILSKLNASSRTEAAVMALQMGLIPVEGNGERFL
ncbi:MAG: response regulator [Anaerolineae bacterium]